MASGKRQSRLERIRGFILDNVASHPTNIASEVSRAFEISRQAAHRHVYRLVEERQLEAKGRTKGRFYRERVISEGSGTFQFDSANEDLAWSKGIRGELKAIRPNIRDICHYGATEVVRNAIDHSEGRSCHAAVVVFPSRVRLGFQDDGVGIFERIQRDCGLNSPREAAFELAKGKLTTSPKIRTGDGIAFTAKMFDRLSVFSGRQGLTHDARLRRSWTLESPMALSRGTGVVMEIRTGSGRTTKEVLRRWGRAEDFTFQKARIPLRLAQDAEEQLVSRSQAQRVLRRLDRFRGIVFDFLSVSIIGQGFADEIFRVFAQAHPEIRLSYAHANATVRLMIERARLNALTQ